MEAIRLGIIGCGIAARELHWPILKNMREKYAITACCNRSEGKAREYAAMAGGIPYTTDYKELVKREDVEAVIISLPIHMNYEVVKASLEAGKHVFLEKPLAGCVEEAEKLMKLESNTSLVTLLGENFRYVSAYRKMKELMDSGVIGRPYAMVFDDFNYIAPEMEFANTAWRVDHKHMGGILLDGGVHRIAAIRSIAGDVRPIGAYVKGVFPDLGKQDIMSLLFEADGEYPMQGVYTVQFSRRGHTVYRMTVFGTEGDLVLEAQGVLCDFRIEVKKDNATIEEIICGDEGIGYLEGFKGEFEDFFHGIRQGNKVKSTFAEGYKDFRVIVDALAMAASSS